MSGTGKMILLVYSLSNEKTSSQMNKSLAKSVYYKCFLKIKKHTQNKKTLKNMFFYRKIKHIKYVLNSLTHSLLRLTS